MRGGRPSSAATRTALAESGIAKEEIVGLGADCTSCTVVALDERFRPLRPAIIWMDVRAADQARRIAASGHPRPEVQRLRQRLGRMDALQGALAEGK